MRRAARMSAMYLGSVDPRQLASRDGEVFGKQFTEATIPALPDDVWRTAEGFHDAVRNANIEIAAERERIRATTSQGGWSPTDATLDAWFTAASGYFSRHAKTMLNAYRNMQ
jgi:hypothetical protein